MITPIRNKFLHKKHLIYYDRDDFDSLIILVKYYLNNDIERTNIASIDKSFVYKYHTNKNRIDEILDNI